MTMTRQGVSKWKKIKKWSDGKREGVKKWAEGLCEHISWRTKKNEEEKLKHNWKIQ